MGPVMIANWVYECLNTITGIFLNKTPDMKIQIGGKEISLNNLSEKDAMYLIKEFTYFDSDKLAIIHYNDNCIEIPAHDIVQELLNIINSCTIFLSYSWKDEKLADEIEKAYKSTNIKIIRDKNTIEYWGSIRKYMKTINSTDYVILLISDSFLKSINCMYEINELLKNADYQNRIFPLVIEKSIYTIEGKIGYITYWEEKYNELNKAAKKIKNIENSSPILSDLKFVKDISYTIGDFLQVISDKNNPNERNFFSGLLNSLLNRNLYMH